MVSNILIVHIGAGNHSTRKTKRYKRLIKQSLDAHNLVESSKILEGSKLTNTGYGSSLNIKGEIECDSSFITAENDTIISGSMYNIDRRYPISEALTSFRKLDKVYDLERNSYGLTKPILVDYRSMLIIDEILGIEKDEEQEDLVSVRAKRVYNLYKDRLFETGPDNSRGMPELRNEITDTIGLIDICDKETKLATSSGGNFFKLPGRIGCAGIIGTAIDFVKREGYEISCMCSGNGEDIIQMRLSNYLVSNIDVKKDDNYVNGLIELIKNCSSKFKLNAVDNNGEKVIYVGVILIISKLSNGQKHLIYCHSTESFYFGYKVKDTDPEIVLSRLNSSVKAGKTFASGEFKIK